MQRGPVDATQRPFRVQTVRTRIEQMSSAVHPITDILDSGCDVRKVPLNEPASAGGAGGAVGRLRLPQ
jgi:hypothetical protein